MNDVFQHLSEDEVEKMYEHFLDEGFSQDDAFTEVYAIDCNMDEE